MDTDATGGDQLPTIDPATAHHIFMPPALVDACADNPELLTQLTRSQLAVVQDRMVHRVLADADVSVSALANVHEQLSKNLRAEKNTSAGNAGTQVVINFVRAAAKDTLTIDGATGKPVEAP